MVGTTPLESVERAPLTDLRFDPRVWPRKDRDAERVAMFASKYQEAGEDALPPLEAVRVEGELLCYDGWHRAAGAHQAGLSELPVVVRRLDGNLDPLSATFVLAVRASTGGHKELNRAERQVGIRRLIEETELSDAEIAEIFGVSRQTVWRRRHGVSDATSREDPGEQYLDRVTAHDAAVRLFRGLEKVYEARGLGVWDAFAGDHTGERLARVLEDAYGDEAPEHAARFREWCDRALSTIERGRS